MLDFSGNDKKAKQVALHYAKTLGNQWIYTLIDNNQSIADSNQARGLSLFYWAMLDQSALDKENGVIVLDESDMQYWMERLLNIISGYLSNNGYQEIWDKVSDEV